MTGEAELLGDRYVGQALGDKLASAFRRLRRRSKSGKSFQPFFSITFKKNDMTRIRPGVNALNGPCTRYCSSKIDLCTNSPRRECATAPLMPLLRRVFQF
jgi:hypothetical protein